MKNAENFLQLYQDNMCPAMYDVLAGQLGVSADVLQRLGVGFIPTLEFKTGRIYKGWWGMPERDTDGKTTGLLTRTMDGRKAMVPGSKRGLIYELYTEYDPDAPTYDAGEQNWIRVHDAGEDCPVCGKGDGCLLSAENPSDPKAVVCCRVREGGVRPCGVGYLHILKEEGRFNYNSPLPPSPYPVVVVEGFTDVAAAMDMGLVGVGRSSALGNMSDLRELLAGRSVIIVGENDQPDKFGRKAGTEGVAAAYENLVDVAKDIARLFPPEEYKDLRDWVTKTGIVADDFLQYAKDHADTGEIDYVLADNAPLHVAESWIQTEYSAGDLPILRMYRGQWFRYEGPAYVEVDPNAVVRGGIYRFVKGKSYKKHTSDGDVKVEKFRPTRSFVSDVVDALNSICPLTSEAPSWIDGREEPDPRYLIPYENGLLDVDAFLEDRPAFYEATPFLFTINSLPYPYDPEATCPKWNQWLEETLGDDPNKIKLLQEWFGYCLTADISQEKLMLFQGRPGAGKSTALDVQQYILGKHQVATTSFGSLCRENGLAAMVGKLAAHMTDARIPKRADSMQALETLLAIVGGDAVNIPRKYLPDLTAHKLVTRFTIAVNELPELPDHSQALQRRLLIIHFANSFVGKENRGLKEELAKEAPGISMWALEGLRWLKQQGRFTMPKSSLQMIDEFRKVTSPVVEFVEDCCVLDEGRSSSITKAELYDAWAKWAYEKGMAGGSRTMFGTRLTSAFPTVTSDTAFLNKRKAAVFMGIDLQEWAARQFLGRTR